MYHVHTATHRGLLEACTADASTSLNGILCEQSMNFKLYAIF